MSGDVRVWVVMERDDDGDDVLALVAATAEAAKRHASLYCGGASLTWVHRNSMFDTQEHWVAAHDGSEFHIYEEEVES